MITHFQNKYLKRKWLKYLQQKINLNFLVVKPTWWWAIFQIAHFFKSLPMPGINRWISQVQHETSEEGQRTHQPKHSEYNNKNEDNSPNTLNDQKFRQIRSMNNCSTPEFFYCSISNLCTLSDIFIQHTGFNMFTDVHKEFALKSFIYSCLTYMSLSKLYIRNVFIMK